MQAFSWSHASSTKSLYESGQHSFLMCSLGHYIATIKTSRCPLYKYGVKLFRRILSRLSYRHWQVIWLIRGLFSVRLHACFSFPECWLVLERRSEDMVEMTWLIKRRDLQEKITSFGNTSSLHISSDRINASLPSYQLTCNERIYLQW